MEEEINVVDYIKVIFKRKLTILFCASGAVCLALLFSFFSRPVYELDTVLEIGHMEDFVPETPAQVAQKISNDVYGEVVRAKLNISKGKYPSKGDMEISTPENTRFVTIAVKTINPAQVKPILDEINRLILKEHQEKFNIQKNIILDDKKRIENKIKSLENEKKILEEKVGYFTNLLANEPSTTNQFFLTSAKEELESKKLDIDNAYLELNTFLRKLEDYEATKVVKAPLAPAVKSLINPKTIIMFIIIGLFVGIFIGIFVGFFQEFWEKNKKILTTGKQHSNRH